MKKLLFLIGLILISGHVFSVSRLYNRGTGDIIDADKDDAEWDNTNSAVNTHVDATTAHGATGGVVGISASQTLTNKILTSPTITTSPTAAAATWTDLGTATAFIATSATLVTGNMGTANFTSSNASITGSTGAAILGLKAVGVPVNLNIVNATTTNAADSIKIECGDTSCSSTNPGFIWIPSATGGDRTLFTITADVTILITGAVWTLDAGDATDAVLRVFAVNAAGTLVHCVGLQGRPQLFIGSSTLDSTTPADINLAEELLCSGAIGADDPIVEWAWFKANFDTTGGAAENLWAVQTGDGDLNVGKADGVYQSFVNQAAVTGFSAAPTVTTYDWVQNGDTICFNTDVAGGTSNAITYTLALPIKPEIATYGVGYEGVDNGTDGGACGWAMSAGVSTLDVYRTPNADTWTGSGTKRCMPFGCYRAFFP